ncbi:MAG TPA: hypothetical protein ENK82_06335 [Campylobacterales bacterium]|nr:hypothetical protein [Campylobacterales bacterium]
MLKILLSTLITLFIVACTPPTNIIIKDTNHTEPLAKSDILQIPIPVREHGYQNFDTQVLSTQAAFDAFIEKIKKQDESGKKVKKSSTWNQKENFINSLTSSNIDFNKYNLLLYRITEQSGATVLSVDAPKGTNEDVIIDLGRDDPEIKTGDMAYYALAYKVAKHIKTITFDNGLKKHTIKNKMLEVNKPPEGATVPQECLEWYDGCNDCGRVGSGTEVVCTERYCVHRDQFRCTKWKN